MNLFFYKLILPRPTFAVDMTDLEKKLMQEHGAYWKNLTDKRIAVVVGPVFDPKCPWGMAVVEVDNEQAAHDLGANDPAVKGGLSFEVYPMGPGSMIRK